jgi:hypothetical protein
MLVLARGSVWARAAAQLNLSTVEMFFKLSPFLLGDISVLVVGAGVAAPCEVFLIVVDDILVKDGDVASCGLEIQMFK